MVLIVTKVTTVIDHHYHDSQVNCVNTRNPHDTPLQLRTHYSLSTIIYGKNIFKFYFLCFYWYIRHFYHQLTIFFQFQPLHPTHFSHRLTPSMRFLVGTSCWRWVTWKWENIWISDQKNKCCTNIRLFTISIQETLGEGEFGKVVQASINNFRGKPGQKTQEKNCKQKNKG